HLARIPLMGEKPATTTWHVFDVATGMRRKIAMPPGVQLVHPDMLPMQATWWSAKGERRFVLAHGERMESALLLEMDLDSGAVRTVIEERLTPRTNMHGTYYGAPNVWLSRDLQQAVWYSQREGTGHLYVYDTSTGALERQLTRGAWFVRDLI